MVVRVHYMSPFSCRVWNPRGILLNSIFVFVPIIIGFDINTIS